MERKGGKDDRQTLAGTSPSKLRHAAQLGCNLEPTARQGFSSRTDHARDATKGAFT